MKRLLWLFILACVSLSAHAQSSFIVPVMTTGGQAVIGAGVTLTCLSGGCGVSTYSASTDSSGNAQFNSVIVGKYTVTVSGSGISTYSYTMTVDSPNPSSLNNIIFVDGVTYPKTQAGIQSAINALPAEDTTYTQVGTCGSGGWVILPSGKIAITSAMTVSACVHIQGQGTDNTILDCGLSSGNCITFNYSSYNFHVQGPGLAELSMIEHVVPNTATLVAFGCPSSCATTDKAPGSAGSVLFHVNMVNNNNSGSGSSVITILSNVISLHVTESTLIGTPNIVATSGGNNTESLGFEGDFIQGYTGNFTGCINWTIAGDLDIRGGSIDGCQIVAGGANKSNVVLINTHLEDPPAPSPGAQATANPMVSLTGNVTFTANNALLYEDGSSVTKAAEIVSTGGTNTIGIHGGTYAMGGGVTPTVPALVSISNGDTFTISGASIDTVHFTKILAQGAGTEPSGAIETSNLSIYPNGTGNNVNSGALYMSGRNSGGTTVTGTIFANNAGEPTSTSPDNNGFVINNKAAMNTGALSGFNTVLFPNTPASSTFNLPVVPGTTSQKSETGTADANVLTVTPSAVAGTFRACTAISVSSATAGVISWTLSWTDSNGNAQSNVAQPLFQLGTAAPNTTFTTSAAGNYSGCTQFDINTAAANIVVKWVGGGTAVAKMSATIEHLN